MTDADMESRIWLVRHGETEWSRLGKHTGREDVPLTAEGEQAARALADRLAGLRFDAVLTSPRVRARRTAELAGFPDAEVLNSLVEWDYGADEGLTTVEIREDRPGWTVWSMGPRGGETVEEVGARADLVLEHVLAMTGTIAVFGHGHFSRVLAARWLGLPASSGEQFKLSTGGISVLGWEREVRAIERWNDTGSLPRQAE
jgi:broad specificity phosphatase PhoE